MKTLPSLFLRWIAMILVLSPALTHAQGENLKAQRTLVVKLRIHRPNQADETAAGFFVGKDKQNAYFITAFHVVRFNGEATVRSVELQFSTTPRRFEAIVFDHFDGDLDLAVVRTALADLPAELPATVKKDATADTMVHIIGHPSAGDWSTWSGSVTNENAPSGDIHHFVTTRDDSLAEGYSGGPVFDGTAGFLGMHTSTEARYGIAAKSGDIVSQLKAWHVPTTNIEDPRETPPLKATSSPTPLREGAYELYTLNGAPQKKGVIMHLQKVSDDRFLVQTEVPLGQGHGEPAFGWSGELLRVGERWRLQIVQIRADIAERPGTSANPGNSLNDIVRHEALVEFRSEFGVFVWRELAAGENTH
jgi:hypothetical protein